MPTIFVVYLALSPKTLKQRIEGVQGDVRVLIRSLKTPQTTQNITKLDKISQNIAKRLKMTKNISNYHETTQKMANFCKNQQSAAKRHKNS